MKRYTMLIFALMLTLAMVLSLAAISACGGDDDDDDDDDLVDDDDDDLVDDDDDDDIDDDDDDDDDDLPFWEVDFDSYTVGALPAPWVVTVTNATIDVSALSKAASGNAMHIVDTSTADGDGGAATHPLSNPELAAAFNLEYEMAMTAGNAMGFGMYMTDTTYGDLDYFYVDYEVGKLTSLGEDNGGAYQDCATFDQTQFHVVTLEINPVARTYSVLLDGAATSCTGKQFLDFSPYSVTNGPLVGLHVFAYDGDGWNGTGFVDNMQAYATVD
ncbi:MAG: hypothetical protein P9M14_04300 [Candidatus Alcyoniella australis]|nr:hypothetical protein [Candidatus Alcyoniella australis]